MRDLIALAWTRNLPAVRLRYPQLGEEDLAALRELGAYPLASGEIVITPEVVLRLLRRLEALERGAPLGGSRRGDPGAGAEVGGGKPRKKGH